MTPINMIVSKQSGVFFWLLLISSSITLFFIFILPFLAKHKQLIPSEAPLLKQNKDINSHGTCDLFTGKWVREIRGPTYDNRTCPTMLESRKCEKYGKDQDFLNWRWKPHGCDLPRFDAGEFLRMVKGKTMFFVGDSLARNHVESLLCLLSQVEKPMNVYKDKEDTSNIWYFKSSNFTLMINFIKFLVQATERTINGTETGVFDIHMDKVDTEWADKLHKTHYIVISTGHWFFRKNYFHENGKLIGCTFCSETNLKEINLSTAIKKATRTALQFIKNSTTDHKTVTLLRTYSPAHFEGGAWNDGGHCNRTRPLMNRGEMLGGSDMEVRNGQVEELEKVKGGEVEFGVVDVTESMMVRADGHPGKHWNNEWMKGFNDCVHWCLPGAVDVWNDMMLQVMRGLSSF